jgi:phosphinothricin acetyltransferase
LIAACIEAGKRQMVAIIGDSAHHPSIRLHEKMGFRKVGVLEDVGFKHGRWLDSVIMQRSIGEGASTTPAP